VIPKTYPCGTKSSPDTVRTSRYIKAVTKLSFLSESVPFLVFSRSAIPSTLATDGTSTHV
jgi:hypothetical protein